MVTGYYPKTISEACMLRRDLTDTMLVAGGSDIMVVKKKAANPIFINGIEELQGVKLEDGVLTIGAGVAYVDLLANGLIPNVLKKAIRNIASPAIRSVGTMGGNICNASPAGDTIPVLYALSAIVVKGKVTKEGELQKTRLPIEEFIQGIRKIALQDDELVLAIEIPTASYEGMTKIMYEKVGARKSEAISKLSFVGLMKVEDEIITDVRIAFGAVSVTAVRRNELEQQLIGRNIADLASLREGIVASYADYICPIDDQRSTANYRKTVSINLLNAFLS